MTQTVRVSFMGICTHLWEDQPNALPNPAWGTRIVLPNASDPDVIALINQKYNLPVPIQPHIAQLTIVRGGFDNIVITLEGARVHIPTDQTTPIEKDARCMPGLGTYLPNIAPGAAATLFDPALASCYFDFQTGMVLGRSLVTKLGAASILYETTLTAVEPKVVIAPFNGDPSIELSLQSALPDITYPVVITNFPAEGDNDNDNDFLLHFLVASAWPETVPQVGPITCIQHPDGDELIKKLTSRKGFDFGMGCSNSNFP